MRILTAEAWLRTVMNPSAEVGLIRVFRGKLHRRQLHISRKDPHHIVFVVESGSLFLKLDGKPFHVQQGRALWIPPGVFRDIPSTAPSQRSLDYRIHFQVAKGRVPYAFARKPILRYPAWDLTALARLILDALRRPRIHADAHVRGLLLALASEFLSLPGGTEKSSAAFTPLERERINTIVDQKIGAAPSVRELAEALGLSADYFSRKFQACYGLSPREFIRRERMRLMAEQLMETNVSLKELCYRFGIDKSQAVRQFRGAYGCTPTQYRRRRSR